MADNGAAKEPWAYRAREAVGVFAEPDALEAAVNQLEMSGFDRTTISVLGSYDEVRKRVGRLYRNVMAIEDDAGASRASFVSTNKRMKDETAAVVFPLYVGGLAGVAAVVAWGERPGSRDRGCDPGQFCRGQPGRSAGWRYCSASS